MQRIGLELGIYAGTTRKLLFCADPAADVHNLVGSGRLSDGAQFQRFAVDGYTSSHVLSSDLILSI